MNFSVGPLTARPATNGLTATTGAPAAAIASRIPGTARIGPIEITGFEGPIDDRLGGGERLADLGRRARRASRPSTSTPSIGGSDALDDQELLQARASPPGSAPACATGSSHIGSTAARTPSARAICAWAAVSVPPSAMKWVR